MIRASGGITEHRAAIIPSCTTYLDVREQSRSDKMTEGKGGKLPRLASDKMDHKAPKESGMVGSVAVALP